MRNHSVIYSSVITFHALADPTRLAVLELLRDEPQSAGQIAEAFPIRLNVKPLASVDAWLERYRMFWAENLSNLKSFVEQEHARKTGKIRTQAMNKAHKRK